MISKSSGEPATAEHLSVVPAEVAQRGWHVMIPGEVYHACFELIEQLLRDGTPNAEGRQFLETLRVALVRQAKPYKPKNQVVPATKLAGLP